MGFREDRRLQRIFGSVYFLSIVVVLSAAVFVLSSDKTGTFLAFVLQTAAGQRQEEQNSFAAESAPQQQDLLHEIKADGQEENGFDGAEPSAELYETPADVSAMEAQYLAVFAAMDTDGDVLEKDFSDAGATDRAENAVIRNATAEQSPDYVALLSQGADLSVPDPDVPLVLIYHTHTSEGYLLSDNGGFWSSYDTHTDAADRNMIRVGEAMKAVLEAAGIGVVHDTTVYDTEYNGAYARSRVGIQKILEEYPSVQIVLDVHRDAFYYSDTERGKPVAVIDGRKAAQVMILSGAEEGQITDFPDWESNLRFALELQNTAGGLYEKLMRPLYFCQRKYNMDMCKNALLVEVGTDANTLDEALYGATLFADVLVKVIENHK